LVSGTGNNRADDILQQHLRADAFQACSVTEYHAMAQHLRDAGIDILEGYVIAASQESKAFAIGDEVFAGSWRNAHRDVIADACGRFGSIGPRSPADIEYIGDDCRRNGYVLGHMMLHGDDFIRLQQAGHGFSNIFEVGAFFRSSSSSNSLGG